LSDRGSLRIFVLFFLLPILKLQHSSYFRLFFMQFCEFVKSIDNSRERILRRRRCDRGVRESIEDEGFIPRIVDERETKKETQETSDRCSMNLRGRQCELVSHDLT
jgi:hypothetical protein